MDRRTLLQLLACTSLTSLACGPATPEPAGPVTSQDAVRDAHALAAKVVSARVTMIIYMDRVRKHPVAPRIAALDAIGEAFEGTDIKPIDDVERAVLAAKTARAQEDAIAVAEHQLTEERIKTAMTQMIAQSGDEGRWLTGYPFPAAKVVVKKRNTVVMAVTPTLLVVTSPKHAKRAATLQNSGGIPDPTNEAAIVADANQPSSSLKAPGVPPVPKTVSHLYADLTLREADGSADLVIDGKSTDEAQAQADAQQLTADIEKAATVKVALFKFQAFEPFEFTPDGNMVRARRRVSQKELDSLLMLAAMMLS
jgi:hypothetical protein